MFDTRRISVNSRRLCLLSHQPIHGQALNPALLAACVNRSPYTFNSSDTMVLGTVLKQLITLNYDENDLRCTSFEKC